jgi:penicillin-binding protein-related factor A (putative recombinase)
VSTGDRGKGAEARIKDALVVRSERADFAHYRWPDARAGSFAVTPADFLAVQRGEVYLLEVKEVKHSRLLPHKNFSPDQQARMTLFQHAGSHCWLVVHHSTTGLWRSAPLSHFADRVKGSWDLSEFPEHVNAPTALRSIFDNP